MAEKFYSLLTNIGKAKIANSVGLGTKINFVTMKVGDGGGAYYEPTEDQTD
jgi:phage-related tail fiber protein